METVLATVVLEAVVLDAMVLDAVVLVEALAVELLAAIFALDSSGCSPCVAEALDERMLSCMMFLP
jgi:hypothetical protein